MALGIFQILSPFETICCQKSTNFSALSQLCLAIKDGPEHIRKFCTKQLFRACTQWIFRSLERDSYLQQLYVNIEKKETTRIIWVKQLGLKKQFTHLDKGIDILSVVLYLFSSTRAAQQVKNWDQHLNHKEILGVKKLQYPSLSRLLPIQHFCYV